MPVLVLVFRPGLAASGAKRTDVNVNVREPEWCAGGMMAVDRKGYWTYRSSDGFEILVGRTAQENDELTFHVAAQEDIWLHVAPTPGSHVVVRNPDHLQRLPRTTLDEAAALAAWYSKCRTAGRVAVHWCRRKDVRKERGSPAGQVMLEKYDQVKVRPAIPPGVTAVDAPPADSL